MDLTSLLKLAGLAAQSLGNNTEVEEEEVPGKANTRPDPQVFPDGPSNLGSVSDTSLRRYLKAKGQPVSVDETTYPDYSVDDVLESYAAYTAEKAKNPYAIGMASAMKTTGDKPPLKKSTINKAHKIAKGIDEASDESSWDKPQWRLEGGKTHMVGGNFRYDDKMEYLLSDENAEILNNFFAQADDAEKSKVWKMFWDHQEKGWPAEAEGPELAIQYAKDAMGMNESDEAMSGTYAEVEYDYSEDFGMITLYKNGQKIEHWNGYFGADTVGNPLADKFVELAMKHNLNPEGMSITDDTGATGTFGNNTFNWDQFAKDETGMNESINESYISELTRVLKNSGQLLNEAGGIGGGISGGKLGMNTTGVTSFKNNIVKSLGDVMPQLRQTTGSDNITTQKLPGRIPDGSGIKGLERAPWSPGDSGAPGDVAIRKVNPNLPGGARPEGPAAGMPAAPDFGMKGRGLAPNTPRIGGKSATITPPVSRPNVGGARPEGPAAGMPAARSPRPQPRPDDLGKSPAPTTSPRPQPRPAAGMPEAPPQPASFNDAFRAARKAAGGAGGVFMWNGKPYQTNIKGEPAQAWNSKDLKKVGNWSASESADANGIAVNEAVAKIACTKCDEVSTAAAWNKNHDTCPKCKTSKQGVAEAAVNKADGKKFGVYRTGGSIGEKKTGKPIKSFATKQEAADHAKALNAGLSKGEKEYYKLKYTVKAISEVAEAAKPDFLDMDKDGDKKEPMKKAVKDKENVDERTDPNKFRNLKAEYEKLTGKKAPAGTSTQSMQVMVNQARNAKKDKEKVSESISYLKRLAGI